MLPICEDLVIMRWAVESGNDAPMMVKVGFYKGGLSGGWWWGRRLVMVDQKRILRSWWEQLLKKLLCPKVLWLDEEGKERWWGVGGLMEIKMWEKVIRLYGWGSVAQGGWSRSLVAAKMVRWESEESSPRWMRKWVFIWSLIQP